MVHSDSSQVVSDIKSGPDVAWYIRGFTLWDRAIFRFSQRYDDAKAKEVERFLKFATVGIIGAIIDFGVLNVLQLTVLRPGGSHNDGKVALATGIAFVSAVTSNFIWNRYWTYPDSRSYSLRRQGTQFFLVNAVGLVFREVWVLGLFAPFGTIGESVLQSLGVVEQLTDDSLERLGTNIAQFFSIWIVMVWNFFVNRYWTYNDVE